MRARRNRIWLLTLLLGVGAAAWMAAGTSPVSAGTVVTATDPSMELSLLETGIASSTGFNCNQVCPTPPGPCTKDNCFVINNACRCHTCAGELKCVREN